MKDWVDWKVIAFGAALMGFGFIFGSSWRAAVDFGDLFTLIGAGFGVFGAYWLATKEKRDKEEAMAQAINRLRNTIDRDIGRLFEEGVLRRQPIFASYMQKALSNINILRDIPLEDIPSQCVEEFFDYIDCTDEMLQRAEMFVNNPYPFLISAMRLKKMLDVASQKLGNRLI